MFQAPNVSPQSHRKRSLRQYFDHKTQDTMTALHVFCRSGSHYPDVKIIIQLQPELISRPTLIGGDTPLHFAVAAHDLATTRLILETNPAAANIKSSRAGNFGKQATPLHVAILTNASSEIIKALTQASPRAVKVRDGNGQTAYQLAVRHCERRDDIDQVLVLL